MTPLRALEPGVCTHVTDEREGSEPTMTERGRSDVGRGSMSGADEGFEGDADRDVTPSKDAAHGALDTPASLVFEDRVDIGVTDVPSGRRWRRPTASVAVIVLIAAVVGAVVGTSGGTGPSSQAGAAVVKAVDHALGAQSAAVSISEQGSIGPVTLNFTGTGGINFSNNSYQMSLSGQVDGQSVTIEGIYIGGSVYEGIPQLSQLAPGKSWISLNLSSLAKASQTSETSALGSNPLATLQTMAQQGNTVTPLGTSTVDGQSVEGYSVTFSQAVLNKELHSATLPSWMRTAVSQTSLTSATEKVFINGTTLVQVSTATDVNTQASGEAKVSESLDFSDYGTAVVVTPPASSETIPFAQFLKLAKQATA